MKSILVPACVGCLALAQAALAQPSPLNPQKSIGQSIEQLPLRSDRLRPEPAMDVLGSEWTQPLQKLLAAESNNKPLEKKIRRYWKPFIGKPVSGEEIRQFNGWIFLQARQLGVLSYAQTTVRRQDDGEVLEVNIVVPTIRSVRVEAPRREWLQRYGELVSQRLSSDMKVLQALDTQGLDQRLDSASDDLPIDLDATVHAGGPHQVDLVVHMTPTPDSPWKKQFGVAQLNNYGLMSYGRAQWLGAVTVQGHRPKASLQLTGQVSEGIRYGRAEYDTTLYGSMHRVRGWASFSDSRNLLGGTAATQSETTETGIGAAGIFDGNRDFVFRQFVETSVRLSHSKLQSNGASTSQVHDQQFRMRTVVDNEKFSQHPSRIDYQMSIGNYSLIDGITAVQSGSYAKLELAARHQTVWSLDSTVYSALRFRSQLSSGRLDSYNQFVLGGVGGVRAYTSADGVGDQGFQLSAELNQRQASGITTGIFYDAGVVRMLNPQSTEYAQNYALQALGMQMHGHYQNLQITSSLAKGIGGNKGWAGPFYNRESTPNNWRLYIALTCFL